MSHTDQFAGVAFAKSLSPGQVDVTIRVDVRGVTATTHDGQRLLVPYDDCVVTRGGFNDSMYFASTGDGKISLGSSESGFRRSLSEAHGGALAEQIAGIKQQRVRTHVRWKTLGIVTVSIIVLLLVAGYYGIIAAARASVNSMPITVDAQIGDAMMPALIDSPEIKDNEVIHAIETIVKRLEPHALVSGFDFRVHVVQDEQINAFALPGGQIVVYTGLIEKAKTPEEVAGVIAHEMAHVTLRHGLKRVAESIGLQAALAVVLGDASGIAGSLAENLTLNSYSRRQESEADEEGVRMMHAAKLNPDGLTDFFELLKHETGNASGAMQWISTHPSHEDRINAIEDQLGELSPVQYAPLDLDWDAVQSRLP